MKILFTETTRICSCSVVSPTFVDITQRMFFTFQIECCRQLKLAACRYAQDVYKHNTWTWVVLKAHSANRAGTVELRSADPRDTPIINMHYFDTGSTKNGEDKRDLIAMAEAVEIGRQISVKVMDPITNTPVFTELLPGADKKKGSKELEDHIKAESWSHHASCTAPIGADNDPMAVLDSKFRVRGVEGLRVVDASVFPRVPGYFIALPTYMIGEKVCFLHALFVLCYAGLAKHFF